MERGRTFPAASGGKSKAQNPEATGLASGMA